MDIFSVGSIVHHRPIYKWRYTPPPPVVILIGFPTMLLALDLSRLLARLDRITRVMERDRLNVYRAGMVTLA